MAYHDGCSHGLRRTEPPLEATQYAAIPASTNGQNATIIAAVKHSSPQSELPYLGISCPFLDLMATSMDMATAHPHATYAAIHLK